MTPSSQTPAVEQDDTASPVPDQGVCKTRWFNQDRPFGVGDEELLSDLRQENPSEICSAPTAIEVQTVDGVPASQTGQEFAVNYASVGFVCLNAEQEEGHRCRDYQVRFTCPPSFCSGVQETQGTELVTTPAPVTEPEQKQTSPDQQGGMDLSAPGPQPMTTHEQTPAMEPVQASLPVLGQVAVDRSTLGPHPVTPSTQTPGLEQAQTASSIPDQGVCQTRWFSRDGPSGVGDEERLSDLRQENPNEICSAPTAIEVQTVGGIPASQTGQEFAVNDASAGFVCIHAEQRNGRRCYNYQVRFTCPPSFCSGGAFAGFQEMLGMENVTAPGPVTEPEQEKTSPDQQVDIDLSTPGPQPVTSSTQTPAMEQVQTTSPFPGEDIKEPEGTEEVTTPGPVSEPDQKQTSPDQQVGIDQSTPGPQPVTSSTQTPAIGQVQTTSPFPDIKEAERMEEVTTFSPVTEPDQMQTSPDQQVGIDQSTLGPYPVTPSSQTPGMEQFQTTSSIPGEGFQEPQGTEKVTPPSSITEPEQEKTSPDQQVGIDLSTLGPQPAASPAQTHSVGQVQTTSPFPGEGTKEPEGTEEVTTPAPVSEPDQKQTSPDQQGVCRTRWFNRDDPSGSGDEELLSELRQENPNEICSAPTAIEVQTVDGIPASQTEQAFAVNYARAGFVCLNADQGRGHRCRDYQVRFTCPPSFCSGVKKPQGTEKVTTSSPLTEPGKQQSSPAPQVGVEPSTPGAEAVTPPAQPPAVEQAQTTPPVPNQVVCQTRWFNRDDPSGVGDEERLSDLRQENPNEICSAPMAIEVQTVGGIPALLTGQLFAVKDASTGFVCINDQQGKDQCCHDYQVRFTCPPSFCCGVKEQPGTEKVTAPVLITEPQPQGQVDRPTPGLDLATPPAQTPPVEQVRTTPPIPDQACKTEWFDRDNPFGTGDHELLSDLLREYPGEICSDPTAMEVQTLDGTPASETGQQFAVNEVSKGFSCLNADQGKGVFCLDHRVRFTCLKSFCAACKTEWFDWDNPFGTGDHELLSVLRREHPGEICSDPTAMEVQTLDGTPASETGQQFAVNEVSKGFSCLHADQGEDVFCLDYRVRFTCPRSFCIAPDRSGSKLAPQPGSKFASATPAQQVQTSRPVQICKTRWFNRDRPTATGDYELLYYLRKDHPGAICSNPIALEVQTLQGIPASETGQKFASNDVVNGFACINTHQGKGVFCHDYKVQFTCPESFCSGGVQ